MEGLLCARLNGRLNNNLKLWLSDGYKVVNDAQPIYMLPFLYDSYAKHQQDMDWLMDTLLTQHWKALWNTDLELPPVFRWEANQSKGPLRLYGVKQPPVRAELFQGWIYALDRRYHSVTLYQQENYRLKTIEEFPLTERVMPYMSSYNLKHHQEIDDTILLRYAFDFAVKLHQENK